MAIFIGWKFDFSIRRKNITRILNFSKLVWKITFRKIILFTVCTLASLIVLACTFVVFLSSLHQFLASFLLFDLTRNTRIFLSKCLSLYLLSWWCQHFSWMESKQLKVDYWIKIKLKSKFVFLSNQWFLYVWKMILLLKNPCFFHIQWRQSGMKEAKWKKPIYLVSLICHCGPFKM